MGSAIMKSPTRLAAQGLRANHTPSAQGSKNRESLTFSGQSYQLHEPLVTGGRLDDQFERRVRLEEGHNRLRFEIRKSLPRNQLSISTDHRDRESLLVEVEPGNFA